MPFSKERRKEYDSSNKIKQKKKEYYLKNREELLQKNKDRNKKHGKKYREKRKNKRNEYQREYYQLNKFNAEYIIKYKLRTRLKAALKAKFWKKTTRFNEYIGCTLEELKQHFEKQFTKEMTWENQGKWHIDHIIPLSSAKTEEEMYKLCHYTNLQPLWAIDNIKKSDICQHQ